MNNEVENVTTEETINVVAEAAKEGLTTGGKFIGIAAATGVAAVIGLAIWGIGKVKNYITSKKETKAEPLADSNLEQENFEEVTEE